MMQDKVLHNTLSQRMKSFYEEYFDRAPENRFESFLAGGHRSLPVMLDCLESDEADAEARTDALIAIGRVFEANGPTADALDMVVHHAKRMADAGMTAERQAALFAIGRSRAESLIKSFLPLIDSDTTEAINIGCRIMGYARWGGAVEAISKVAAQKDPKTLHASTWALGEIGGEAAVKALLGLLNDEVSLEHALDGLTAATPLAALEAMVGLLSHESTKIRLSAMIGVRSVVVEHKETLLTKGADWMLEALNKAVEDSTPPVGVFAMLTLAELGRKLDKEAAYRVLNIQGRPEQASVN
jgi:hypothetical protein